LSTGKEDVEKKKEPAMKLRVLNNRRGGGRGQCPARKFREEEASLPSENTKRDDEIENNKGKERSGV